jgi:hypothetical protein
MNMTSTQESKYEHDLNNYDHDFEHKYDHDQQQERHLQSD